VGNKVKLCLHINESKQDVKLCKYGTLVFRCIFFIVYVTLTLVILYFISIVLCYQAYLTTLYLERNSMRITKVSFVLIRYIFTVKNTSQQNYVRLYLRSATIS
jgi:hypothetical protein